MAIEDKDFAILCERLEALYGIVGAKLSGLTQNPKKRESIKKLFDTHKEPVNEMKKKYE